jgi:hypothetical protein
VTDSYPLIQFIPLEVVPERSKRDTQGSSSMGLIAMHLDQGGLDEISLNLFHRWKLTGDVIGQEKIHCGVGPCWHF